MFDLSFLMTQHTTLYLISESKVLALEILCFSGHTVYTPLTHALRFSIPRNACVSNVY